MTIEIHRPEIEALLQERMQSGAFHDVEDVLLHALKTSWPVRRTGKDLVDACAKVSGLLTGGEVDARFSRDRSFSRPVDLE